MSTWQSSCNILCNVFFQRQGANYVHVRRTPLVKSKHGQGNAHPGFSFKDFWFSFRNTKISRKWLFCILNPFIIQCTSKVHTLYDQKVTRIAENTDPSLKLLPLHLFVSFKADQNCFLKLLQLHSFAKLAWTIWVTIALLWSLLNGMPGSLKTP